MKKFLLATVSCLALLNGARAADLPTKARTYALDPVEDWTGSYVGVQGGIARHNASFNDFTCAFGCRTTEGNKTGGIGGGLLGYNWQRGGFVYGLEGDWNWIGAKTATRLGLPNATSIVFDQSYDVNWLGTLRGRAGLAVDATLVYITGGVAFGHVKNSFGSSSGSFSFIQQETKIGWTAGAGVEHMLSSHWIARAEFRYVDLGTTGVSCAAGTSSLCASYRSEFSNTLMTGMVGLNYKF